MLDAAREYHIQYERRTLHFKSDCFKYNQAFSYLPIDGTCRYSSREFDVAMNFNSKHLRDKEQDLSSPEIIAVGDSHTMGWGVEAEDTFAHHLQESLGKKILNAGIPSFGTARQMMLLRKLDRSATKLIFWQYSDNDVRENFPFLNNNNHLQIMNAQQYLQSSATEYGRINDEIYASYLRRFLPIVKRHWKNRHRTTKSKELRLREDHREANAFLDILEPGIDILNGIPIVLFEINSHNQNDNQFLRAVAKELKLRQSMGRLQGLNLRTIELSDSLTAKHYFVHDDHLNPRGQQLLANRLATVPIS